MNKIPASLQSVTMLLIHIFAVPVFKFWGICFSDQVAWVAAICYIVPTMFYVLKRVDKVDYKAVK